MARRRSFLERPTVHLQRAADAHARLTAGEEPPRTEHATPIADEPPSQQSLRAKAQPRGGGGKFA